MVFSDNTMKSISNIIKKLPQSPGVYIFKNRAGEIIYIGKAVNINRRVKNYFIGTHDIKTTRLMQEVVSIDYKKTQSALEALILEANYTKQYKPIYNIKQKDDKTFLYVWISREQFPIIELVRGSNIASLPEKNPKLFGPYLSGVSLKAALEILRPIIPYRSCHKLPKRMCLFGHIGLCSAPCLPAGRHGESNISPQDYKQNIRQLIQFLKGNKKSVVRTYIKLMKQASAQNDFEATAIYRDKVKSLQHIKDVATLGRESNPTKYHRIEGYDISNISGVNATGSMVVFIEGQSEKSEYRKFKIKTIAGANDIAMLQEILRRRFRHNEWQKPNLIIIDGGQAQLNTTISVLNKKNLIIPVIAIAKGPSRKKSDLRFSGTDPGSDINLIRQVRNEAHRFAIGYYRKLHRKKLVQS